MKRGLLIAMLLLVEVATGTQTTMVRGIVVDSTQALIPGVQVTLEHLETGEKLTTISDETGNFAFLGARPGKVRITASLPGFTTWTAEVQLGAGTTTLAPITLKVAAVATSVEVTISNPLMMSTSSASVGVFVPPGGGFPAVQLARRRDVVDRGYRRLNTESYDPIQDNPFIRVSDRARSTFAVDVDTASYANMRRFLNTGELPPKDAVRIEELVNYFRYSYGVPSGPHPVAIHTEVASPFWKPSHRLVQIGIRARDVDISSRKKANLVFLVDVSGSMQLETRLPHVQRSLHLLVDKLRDDDIVAMVVYAGSSGLVLPATAGTRRQEIHDAIDKLAAGGSTNGGEGIRLAYRVAAENLIKGGINRVILATDGDFNVGMTNQGDLVRLIEQQAQSGVSLTVLGFGMGNYKDSTLEKLANKGHGNYAYIDTIQEARRVLVEQMSGTLQTVAKDVKLQIEFNPREVQAYRLLGYENRLLDDADFDNDNKKGGDMGAGHNVTAFFEVVPVGATFEGRETRPLRYQGDRKVEKTRKGELLTVSLRYKEPEGNRSVLLEVPASDAGAVFEKASSDFRFAASVAAFAMLLRDSPHKGTATAADVVTAVSESGDMDATRLEFAELVGKAASMLPPN